MRASSASWSTRSLKSQPRQLAVEVERRDRRGRSRAGAWTMSVMRSAMMHRRRAPMMRVLEPRAEAVALESPHSSRKRANRCSRRARRCDLERDEPRVGGRGCGARAARPGRRPRPGARHVGGVRRPARSRNAATSGSCTSQSWISPSRSCSSLTRLTAVVGVGAEARAGQLEHVAQALGGDPHVVQRVDLAPGRAARGMNEHSSSSRVRTIRSALSASGPAGSRPLTLRAFTRASSRRPASASSRPRRSGCAACSSAAASDRVARRLRARSRAASAATPARSARGTAAGELLQRVDLHVGVAALAERVGQRLDVAQRRLERLGGEARARRSPAPRAAAAWRRACRARARCRRVEHVVGVLEQLLGADRDDARGRRREGLARVERRSSAALAIRRLPPRARARRPRAGRRGRSAAGSRARCAAASRISMPGRQQPHALGVEVEALARPPLRARPRARAARAASVSGSSTAPTSRRSEVALPPTATAASGRGTSRPSNTPAGVRAQRVQLGRRRAGRSAGSRRRAGPSRRGTTPHHVTPPPTRADRDLGRAAADVDDADAALGARPSVRVAPTKARRASSSPSRTRPRRRRARATTPAELVAVRRAADRRRGHGADRSAPASLGQPRCAATTVGDLGDLRARDRAAGFRPLPIRVKARCWSTSRSRPSLGLGDEQAGRVRADVDAGAEHGDGGAGWHDGSVTATAAIEVDGLRKAYGDARGRPRASTSPSRAARSSACSAPTARARRPPSRSSRATASATAARSRVLGHDPADRPRDAAQPRRHRPAELRHLPAPDRARGGRALGAPLPGPARRRRGDRARRASRSAADRRARTLSGGQQRRLDFALALVGDPELIFLDEPTTGFDPAARRAAWEAVRSLRDLGKTVLLTTHYLDEAQALADRVAIVKDGAILAEGRPAS